jgi:hypothetical protein
MARKTEALEEIPDAPAAQDGGALDDGIVDEGLDPEVPVEFVSVNSETVIRLKPHPERAGKMVLTGRTPVTYRGVIEFDPPRKRLKKDPEGSGEMDRIEFFFNDPEIFYWLFSRASREMPDRAHPDIRRGEAVILAEGSRVIWEDRNPDERE